jgi:hypothetical protein
MQCNYRDAPTQASAASTASHSVLNRHCLHTELSEPPALTPPRRLAPLLSLGALFSIPCQLADSTCSALLLPCASLPSTCFIRFRALPVFARPSLLLSPQIPSSPTTPHQPVSSLPDTAFSPPPSLPPSFSPLLCSPLLRKWRLLSRLPLRSLPRPLLSQTALTVSLSSTSPLPATSTLYSSPRTQLRLSRLAGF